MEDSVVDCKLEEWISSFVKRSERVFSRAETREDSGNVDGGRVMPRLKASCCSGSMSSVSGPEERRRVLRVRAGECVAEEVRRLWVFGFAGRAVLMLGGMSSIRDSSLLVESRTNCKAILWH